MMLAVHAMSHGAQAICFFIAMVAFIVAAVVTWIAQPRPYWAFFVALGLAFTAFVNFWTQLAAS